MIVQSYQCMLGIILQSLPDGSKHELQGDGQHALIGMKGSKHALHQLISQCIILLP